MMESDQKDSRTPLLDSEEFTCGSTLPSKNHVPSASPKKGLKCILFLFLGLASFLDGLGLGLGISFLPIYVVSHFHVPEVAAGTLVSMYGFGALAGTIMIFPMKSIGIIGRKLLILSILILLLSSILFCFSGSSLKMMNVTRFLQGSTYAGIWSVISEYLNEFYPPCEVGGKMANMLSFFYAGVIFGPPLGSWLFIVGGHTLVFPFLLLACACIIPLVGLVILLPEICTEESLNVIGICQQMKKFKDRNIVIGFVGAFLSGGSTFWVESTASIYFYQTMGWSSRTSSYLYTISGLSFCIVGIWAGKITGKLRVFQAFFICQILTGFGIFSTCIPTQLYVWGFLPENFALIYGLDLFTFILFGASVALSHPPFNIIVSEAINRTKINSTVLLNGRSFFVALGYVIIPIISSSMADALGYPTSTMIGFVIFSFFGIIGKIYGIEYK